MSHCKGLAGAAAQLLEQCSPSWEDIFTILSRKLADDLQNWMSIAFCYDLNGTIITIKLQLGL